MNSNNFPYWTTDLKRFEVIKRKPSKVGSIGQLHYFRKGRSYIMKDELIDCKSGERYLSQVSGDALTAEVKTTLHTSGNKTEMHIKWSGKGKIFLLKILLPLLRGKMLKQSKAELVEAFKN